MLRRRLTIVLEAALLISGCGGDSESKGRRADAIGNENLREIRVPQRDGWVADFADDGSASGGFTVLMESGDFGGSASAPPPVEELYAVFTRPRTGADREAGELAVSRGALDLDVEFSNRPPDISAADWKAAQPGEVLEGKGRLLLAGLGGEWNLVYAAPTTNDHVCVALLPNGGGGCGAPGPDGLDLEWVYS